MAVLRILGKASSINVRKVLWTCDEIGIPYLREDWGSGFASTTTPEFLAMNPNGFVPVIESEDGILWESNTICRYLAARHGRFDLLPEDPWHRALVEKWMDWQATDLNRAWIYPFQALVRGDAAFADQAMIAPGVAGWNSTIAILDRQLATGGPFIAGEAFTLADIVIGLSINRWLRTPIERPDMPSLADYFARLAERPAFRGHGYGDWP